MSNKTDFSTRFKDRTEKLDKQGNLNSISKNNINDKVNTPNSGLYKYTQSYQPLYSTSETCNNDWDRTSNISYKSGLTNNTEILHLNNKINNNINNINYNDINLNNNRREENNNLWATNNKINDNDNQENNIPGFKKPTYNDTDYFKNKIMNNRDQNQNEFISNNYYNNIQNNIQQHNYNNQSNNNNNKGNKKAESEKILNNNSNNNNNIKQTSSTNNFISKENKTQLLIDPVYKQNSKQNSYSQYSEYATPQSKKENDKIKPYSSDVGKKTKNNYTNNLLNFEKRSLIDQPKKKSEYRKLHSEGINNKRLVTTDLSNIKKDIKRDINKLDKTISSMQSEMNNRENVNELLNISSPVKGKEDKISPNKLQQDKKNYASLMKEYKDKRLNPSQKPYTYNDYKNSFGAGDVTLSKSLGSRVGEPEWVEKNKNKLKAELYSQKIKNNYEGKYPLPPSKNRKPIANGDENDDLWSHQQTDN